jgi:predicted Zn-dependent protease
MFLALSLAAAHAGAEEAAPAIPPGEGDIEQFLGCKFSDGKFGYAAVTEADMPWRVAIGMPRNSPRYGSRKKGREAAIDAMRLWERAIQSELPWFALEFVEKDPAAPVQIEWKRRMTGKAQGRAGPRCAVVDGQLKAGGGMEIAVRACPTCTPLQLKEVEMLVAHEFGHILGLGHCLDCESAMSYAWHTRDRVFVTQTDVRAVVRRFQASADLPPEPTLE